MIPVTCLKRQNVFTSEDLGFARGCSKYFSDGPELIKELSDKRTAVKKSKHKKTTSKVYIDGLVESCAELFAPYKIVFMFILWRLSATHVDAIAKNERQFVEG